jgi:glycosyltransferase involved in cell wall biosynthesis
MRLVFLSYNYSAQIKSPEEWIDKIGFYTGWAKIMAKEHAIFRVDQIDYEGDIEKDGIHYYFVKDKDSVQYLPRKLNRFVKSLKPDGVLVSSFMFPIQVLLLRRCLGKKVKILVQNHAEKPSSGLKRSIQKIASHTVDAFLFNSFESGMQWVQNGNIDSPKKIFELPEVSSLFYPLEKSLALEKTKVSGSPVFLWVGRLNQNKDPKTVLSAFIKFSKYEPGAKLYFIYQTEELLPELKALVEEFNQKENIFFIGKVRHNQLLYWFNSADFFISASHYEGSGTALCEAMSCGCIPIISNIPSFRTINGDSGLFFEPGNPEDLFSLLKKTSQMDMDEEKTRVLSQFKNENSFESISNKFQKIAASF